MTPRTWGVPPAPRGGTWLYLLLDQHPAAREQALAAAGEGSAGRRQAIQALVHETLRL
ncbi:hypothetical protein [Streptomyces mirabilis]|uniref:hypothetical protein n=1 Tax=Streptomyces mirabilis TaxID=68239 RepID=UPI0034083361